jgi:hypothetical protein
MEEYGNFDGFSPTFTPSSHESSAAVGDHDISAWAAIINGVLLVPKP